MNPEFTYIKSAAQLPPEWDQIGDSYFQQRSFLLHAEQYNPCKQRYYVCYENGQLLAGAVVYTLGLSLLTFLKVKSTINMQIVGVPCSVSSPGIFGKPEAVAWLKKHISANEKGMVLCLKIPEKTSDCKGASGKMLPTILFYNRFGNWGEYLAQLRSPYRRRLNQILKNGKELSLERTDCSVFDEEMYSLYLQVFEKSNEKLEKLEQDFFRHLPKTFLLTTCRYDGKLIGWNIACYWEKSFYFFLGGLDYKMNARYHTYFYLLANLLKDGIESGAEAIDLGQTGEIPKMRLGGIPVERYMEATHHWMVVGKILKWASPLLEYKVKIESNQVFMPDQQ